MCWWDFQQHLLHDFGVFLLLLNHACNAEHDYPGY